MTHKGFIFVCSNNFLTVNRGDFHQESHIFQQFFPICHFTMCGEIDWFLAIFWKNSTSAKIWGFSNSVHWFWSLGVPVISRDISFLASKSFWFLALDYKIMQSCKSWGQQFALGLLGGDLMSSTSVSLMSLSLISVDLFRFSTVPLLTCSSRPISFITSWIACKENKSLTLRLLDVSPIRYFGYEIFGYEIFRQRDISATRYVGN